jgi:hypothetical protein
MACQVSDDVKKVWISSDLILPYGFSIASSAFSVWDFAAFSIHIHYQNEWQTEI